MNARSLRKSVDRRLGELWAAGRRVREEQDGLNHLEARGEDILTAQSIAQQVAQSVQQRAHDQIAAVVSRCLETVFERPYAFTIEFRRARGRTEAVLTFERDGVKVDPLSASGGGVVDVAAFALRLAALLLHRPPVRRLLVLDEPFKFLDRASRSRVRSLLSELAEDFEVQLLIVTHFPDLRTGEVLEIV